MDALTSWSHRAAQPAADVSAHVSRMCTTAESGAATALPAKYFHQCAVSWSVLVKGRPRRIDGDRRITACALAGQSILGIVLRWVAGGWKVRVSFDQRDKTPNLDNGHIALQALPVDMSDDTSDCK